MTHPRDTYNEHTTKLATEAFANHQIVEESEGRWLLRKPSPDGGFHWTEIIALAGNGLLVDGDIDHVIFRYGPKHPEARVRWMGSRKTAHDCYFVEKAIIGTGHALVETWRSEVALADLDDIAKEIREEHGDSTDKEGLRAIAYDLPRRGSSAVLGAIEDIKRFPYDMDERSVLDAIMQPDYFDEPPLVGTVAAQRLFFAHAALARLTTLLDTRTT